MGCRLAPAMPNGALLSQSSTVNRQLSMVESILSAVFLAAILVASWFITDRFARWMYRRCEKCGTLNAKRRAHCRSCSHPLAGTSS